MQQADSSSQGSVDKPNLLRSHLGDRRRKESQVPTFIWGNRAWHGRVHKFRGRNSLRKDVYNSPTINHVYLFNYLRFKIFLYLFITFNLFGAKKYIYHLGHHYNSGFCYRKISEKSIVGPDNYGLRNYCYIIIIFISSQKFNFELRKFNCIRFTSLPWPKPYKLIIAQQVHARI